MTRTIEVDRQFSGFALAKPNGEKHSGVYLTPEFLSSLSGRLHHAKIRAEKLGPLPDAFRDLFTLFDEVLKEHHKQWLSDSAPDREESERQLRAAQQALEDVIKRLPPNEPPRKA